VSVPSSKLGPPTPSPQASVSPPGTKGGHTRLRMRKWGCPNSDDWRKILALCILTLCLSLKWVAKHACRCWVVVLLRIAPCACLSAQSTYYRYSLSVKSAPYFTHKCTAWVSRFPVYVRLIFNLSFQEFTKNIYAEEKTVHWTRTSIPSLKLS
jgi:hypothetical protein